jgi:hypothetical protein
MRCIQDLSTNQIFVRSIPMIESVDMDVHPSFWVIDDLSDKNIRRSHKCIDGEIQIIRVGPARHGGDGSVLRNNDRILPCVVCIQLFMWNGYIDMLGCRVTSSTFGIGFTDRFASSSICKYDLGTSVSEVD